MLIAPNDREALRVLYGAMLPLEGGAIVKWLTGERERLREANERELIGASFRQIQGALRAITALLKHIEAARDTLRAIER